MDDVIIYFRYSFYFNNLNGNKGSVIPAIVESIRGTREQYPVSSDRFRWEGDVLYYEPGGK
ncbi:hypothetical protein J4405_02295 [Candidatus Woesearchaeota archaeon]|nr:hypothetical protein [Candidatus Woesearchaeota archaeon]